MNLQRINVMYHVNHGNEFGESLDRTWIFGRCDGRYVSVSPHKHTEPKWFQSESSMNNYRNWLLERGWSVFDCQRLPSTCM